MKKEKVFISHGDIILDKIYDKDLNLIKQDGGGCNWNDLYNLSMMGEKCYAIGSKGNDTEGNIAIQSLIESNVNTDYVISENKKTNIMNVIIPDRKLQDNSILHSWYSPITYEYTMNFSENLPTELPKELENDDIYIILDKFQPVNLRFIQNIKSNYTLCLDFGHIRFFEHFTKQYLSLFLEKAKFIQLNNNVIDLLFDRFEVKNEIEFFSLFNFDLLVLTKGKKGATFIFKENDEIKIVDKKPEVIVDIVDSSGAGDAFFSKTLQQYAYTNNINIDFINMTFKLANKLSCEVISQVGSRVIKNIK